MIVVYGTLKGSAQTIVELTAASLVHVHRSRGEPGCLSHDVHVHVEDPLLLVFIERWANMEALRTHFAVPASGEFVRSIRSLVTAAPLIKIYDVTELDPGL